MRGEATPVQTAALLMGLRAKGETADEVAGAARALRLRDGAASRPRTPTRLVDTCGTGGGRVGTLNISTAAAFVVAGAGVPVAKHGNRSFTSRSGSADVLEALGVDDRADAPRARGRGAARRPGSCSSSRPASTRRCGTSAPVRKELGVPTIMNLLGPLVNPAGVTRQVIGVSDGARAPLLAGGAGAGSGRAHALVLHADGRHGRGESRAGRRACGRCGTARWPSGRSSPARYGLDCDDLDGLAGGEPAENAQRIERLLAGENGCAAVRCAVLLNAAAALYVSGGGWTLRGGGGAGDGGAGRRGGGSRRWSACRQACDAHVSASA